jgi:NADPH2:quinone reductase
MKAAVYYQTGSPDVFRYEDVPDPAFSPAEMLVAVEAISVEGGDTLNRLGGEMAAVPHVVGYQCAGVVVACGAQVEGYGVGDRVVTLGLHGSHAALRAVHPAFCWRIPDGLDTLRAACVPTAYGTAHDCLFEFGRLGGGESVLVHAGASGVGIAAIQMAHRAGARVLATASSDDRLARLGPLGLDHGINYVTTDFVAAVRDLTDGRGADVIVDSVGGENLQRSLHALAYRGRCVSFGDAGRDGGSPLDVSTMRAGNQSLTGYFLGAELFSAPRAHAMIAELLAQVARDELRVVIDRTYPLEDAAEAHEYIESRRAFGRVVLVP